MSEETRKGIPESIRAQRAYLSTHILASRQNKQNEISIFYYLNLLVVGCAEAFLARE